MTNSEIKALLLELGLIEKKKYGKYDYSRLSSKLGIAEQSAKQMLKDCLPTPTWAIAFVLGYQHRKDEDSST